MKYIFVGRVLKQGNRYFMKIPFNIWEMCGQKGLIPVKVCGLSVDEIIDIMQSRAWQCSFSKLLEALDYFGISYDDKFTYTRGRNVVLPECEMT